MNKTVKEKKLRERRSLVPVRYGAQMYQSIDLTPLTMGRRFSLDQKDPPYVTEPQQLVNFTTFTHI